MKIVIDKPEVNFEIEGKEYSLSLTDDNIEKFYKCFNDMQRELAEPKVMNSLKDSRELAIKSMDKLLGEGESIEIYNKTGKSTFVMVQIFGQIVELIGEKADELKADRFKKMVEKR